jgi:putative tryptophan/tyrosine transport system substrate-binding protein
MRRREFIAGLAATSVSSVVARAQQPSMPVIGLLNNNSPHLWVSSLRAFHQGLREAGYVEGQNVATHIAGQMINTTDFRRSRLIWSAVRLP